MLSDGLCIAAITDGHSIFRNPFEFTTLDRSSCTTAYTNCTEEIHRRRSAALTEWLNLASRDRELKSMCCDMLPIPNEPRPSGMCVISVDPYPRCMADDSSAWNSDGSQASSLLRQKSTLHRWKPNASVHGQDHPFSGASVHAHGAACALMDHDPTLLQVLNNMVHPVATDPLARLIITSKPFRWIMSRILHPGLELN